MTLENKRVTNPNNSAVQKAKRSDSDDAKVPLFALVIGIDDYQSVRKLKGAVSDANKIVGYLQQHLGVPSEQITILHDKAATRKGIEVAFQKLQDDPSINPQDAILIYFAGHGRDVDALYERDADEEKTQVISPQDVGGRNASSRESRDTNAPHGRYAGEEEEKQFILPQDAGGRNASSGAVVDPISRGKIASLLDELAHKKGDNIVGRGDLNIYCETESPPQTVILDCCHSGLEENRSQENEPDSYVLLVACGADEVAWEKNGAGLFTTKLLETLGKCTGPNKVTYAGLLQLLTKPKLPDQTPQCIGKNKGRILFNNKPSLPDTGFPIDQQTKYTRNENLNLAANLLLEAPLVEPIVR